MCSASQSLGSEYIQGMPALIEHESVDIALIAECY